ncbi:MAG: Threonylcarbamoyl-AMP synthase [Lentisphaerae bacterium ADurb.Bin082]|nr:MAG: Threonylcarbamoyl-AMP synthase [Lentisphaerae bacterium ADurb.Bin082]HQL87822.1 L-threonylcarbamoyladenylate synthase [Lentisphaeria bacterium]
MKRCRESDSGALDEAAAVLRAGGVVALPTETVYGLTALWRCQGARQKIYQLKHRPADKRLQMLAASISVAVAAGLCPDERLERLGRHFWPGALTVVSSTQGGDSIGLRVPAHPFLAALLGRLGEPLAATSANASGQPAAVTAPAAVCGLDGEPDLLIDGGEVSVTAGTASTVVSLLGPEAVILRQGPIGLAAIQAALAVV